MLSQRSGRSLVTFQLALLLLLLLALAAARAWTVGDGSRTAGYSRPSASLSSSSVLDSRAYPWLLLRDGRELAAGEAPVSVIAVGDIMLGRGVADEPAPLQDVAGWLPAADLTLGNLESPLTAGRPARTAPAGDPQPILLRAEPEQANVLKQAGLDILGLANNHALDYGPDGLADTVAALESGNLAAIGLLVEGEEERPLIREVDGVRLAFLAFNAVSDPQPDRACRPDGSCLPRPLIWDPVAGPAAIAEARGQAQAVVVSVHWGFEYHGRPDPYQEAIAASMLAAGADLILGHHPHVAQPVVISGNRVVAYSLGNFLFDQAAGDTRYGLALRAFFDRDGLRAVQILPLQAGPRPRLLNPDEAKSLLSRALPEPPQLGFRCKKSACSPVDAPRAGQTGLFYTGRIDLTGDGRPETVRRQGSRILIYEGESLTWQSPAGWQVVDAALGDPNDDGRYEIMLAIWQKDEAGHLRSQPYIVGYRGGEYTLLWGGRPVANSIQEVALGDVDGDATDELVVIEESANGSSQTVSVWRWGGWTFSLVWRSEPGWYRDLILGQENQIQVGVVSATERE